jgi:hypothetical protein
MEHIGTYRVVFDIITVNGQPLLANVTHAPYGKDKGFHKDFNVNLDWLVIKFGLRFGLILNTIKFLHFSSLNPKRKSSWQFSSARPLPISPLQQ